MYYPSDKNPLCFKNATPRFLCDESNKLYWLTDNGSGVVLSLRDRETAIDLHNQIKAILKL